MSASRQGQPPDPSERSGSIRYPELHVSLHSGHPLALVSAVRHALRRAGVDAEQISTFSRQALGPRSTERARRVCNEWVHVDAPAA